jgi:hypothetical protein
MTVGTRELEWIRNPLAPETVEQASTLQECIAIVERLPLPNSRIEFPSQEYFTSSQWLFEGKDPQHSVDIETVNSEINQWYCQDSALVDSYKHAAQQLTLKTFQYIKKLLPSVQDQQQLYNKILFSYKRVLLNQHMASSYPKFYHRPRHTLKVVFGILDFLDKAPQTKEFLGNTTVVDLVLNAINHDSIMHVHYCDDPDNPSEAVSKYEHNEALSTQGIESGSINLSTKVSKGTPDDFPIVIKLSNLWGVIASDADPRKKVAQTILAHYDTRSASPEDFLSNGLLIWMEEYALKKIVFGELDSQGCDPDHTIKHAILRSLFFSKSLHEFVDTIVTVLKTHDIPTTLIYSITHHINKKIKSFIEFQSIIAYNFRQNADTSTTALEEQGIDSTIIHELRATMNYREEFDRYIKSSAFISIILQCKDIATLDDLIHLLESDTETLWQTMRDIEEAMEIQRLPNLGIFSEYILDGGYAHNVHKCIQSLLQTNILEVTTSQLVQQIQVQQAQSASLHNDN